MLDADNQTAGLHFRWLGAAGVELEAQGEILAIDPFFTRPPLWKSFSRVAPDQGLIAEKMRPYRAILVTHPHYDHLMDVAEIARRCGAGVYGSANTCQILAMQGLPASQIHRVQVGDELTAGSFQVIALKGSHIRLPIDAFIDGSLVKNLRLPLRPVDYRMDEVFSYHIRINGLAVLHGEQSLPADVWLFSPYQSLAACLAQLETIHPKLVIPIHWDDFFRPLARPLRPMLARPSWKRLPLSRIDLQRFRRDLEAAQPGLRVLAPSIFTSYDLW